MTDGDLRQLVAVKDMALAAGDAYLLLGVHAPADDVEIRRAYNELQQLLQPTRLRRRDLGNLRRAAERVYESLPRAYEALATKEARKEYAEHGGMKAPWAQHRRRELTEEQLYHADPASLGDKRIEAAELVHIRGVEFVAKHQLDRAEKHFERARNLDPDSAIHALRLGWTIFKNPFRTHEQRLAAARAPLEHAAAADPYNPNVRYCMAKYWAEAGHNEGYVRELEAVLRCDADHELARAHLTHRNEEARSRRKPRGIGRFLRTKKRASGAGSRG